jgi:DNA-directed RNA polymerase subunit RPC12/RpoP
MIIKCPNCKKDIDSLKSNLEYDKKHGRVGTCPECGKRFFLSRHPGNYVRGKNGELIRNPTR